jgi:hypothetical protein
MAADPTQFLAYSSPLPIPVNVTSFPKPEPEPEPDVRVVIRGTVASAIVLPR